jgi:hypothetical protein
VTKIAGSATETAISHTRANRRSRRSVATPSSRAEGRVGAWGRAIPLTVWRRARPGITRKRDLSADVRAGRAGPAPAQGARRPLSTKAACVTGIARAKNVSSAAAKRRISRCALSALRSEMKFMRLRAFTVQ